MNQQIVKTKVLRKVRRNFLNKRPNEEETRQEAFLPQQVDPIPIQLISTSMGIVERNRRLCFGVRFLSTHASVQSVKIETQTGCKAVTFNIELNDNIPQAPWEYYVKRLESFGDLNMATWAHKLKNHYTIYPQVLNQYLKLAKSDNPQILAGLRKAKNKAVLAHKKIESQYAYKRVTLFANEKRTIPIAASYSEGILKDMGYSLESFASWAEENGIPTLFGGECPIHADIAKSFLDCSMFQGDPVKFGSEYITYIYDKNKSKRKMVVQMALIVEPAAEGLFVTGYAIFKNPVGMLNVPEHIKTVRHGEESHAIMNELKEDLLEEKIEESE